MECTYKCTYDSICRQRQDEKGVSNIIIIACAHSHTTEINLFRFNINFLLTHIIQGWRGELVVITFVGFTEVNLHALQVLPLLILNTKHTHSCKVTSQSHFHTQLARGVMKHSLTYMCVPVVSDPVMIPFNLLKVTDSSTCVTVDCCRA